MIAIKDLDKLLAAELGENKVIASYTTESLIAPGENYGSVMLAVNIKTNRFNNNKEEDLHLVAKLCPPSEFIRKMFNIPVTFKKEIGFYNAIVPTILEFQKERGCDADYKFFPKYYGARINLNDSNNVDDDACLLLENLKVKGFGSADRLKGFDLETAKYIIKDLAKFHAVPIALKIIKPDLFEKNIKPHLISYIDEKEVAFNEEILRDLKKMLMGNLIKNEECVKYIDRIEALITQSEKGMIDLSLLICEEPFNSIIHNDLWVNNTMVKLIAGRPIGNCMVDFQMTLYGNPAHDLIFFIYTSLSNDLIAEYYKELVDLYFNSFIDVLKVLKIDTEPFRYDIFLDLIDDAAKKYVCYHILTMLTPVFTDKNKLKNLGEINENDASVTDTLSDLYYPKLWGTILSFVEHKWL